MSNTAKDSNDTRAADLRKIWGGARTLGIDADDLHLLVKSATGRDSIAALTATERAKVVRELEFKGAFTYRKGRTANAPRPARKRERGGKGTDLITPAQMAYLDALWTKLAEREPNAEAPAWRAAFVHRVIRRPWPQKKWEASKVIEALKKRLEG